MRRVCICCALKMKNIRYEKSREHTNSHIPVGLPVVNSINYQIGAVEWGGIQTTWSLFQPWDIVWTTSSTSTRLDEDDPYVVLWSHWQHAVKRCGTCCSRRCVDGSRRTALILHILANSYSSCVNQPVQRLSMAISALKNNLLFGGDAVIHTLMHGQTFPREHLLVLMHPSYWMVSSPSRCETWSILLIFNQCWKQFKVIQRLADYGKNTSTKSYSQGN